ncbi:MAG: AAA family ATPase, partial [Oscillospiraceae bacterium]|nr:AAA family ATPase [Oscillospiraceae bacterium]
RHPYDVSGGEIQLCALALLMLRRPKILLLDEPTKGIDSGAKAALTALLKELAAEGAAVLTVTHDPDFAAGLADRCGLLFDGEILSEDARDFFVGNSYSTTAANRMARHLFAGAVTVEEAAERCNVQLGGTS